MIPAKIGRYKIWSELGRGGMATVYHAYDPFVKREVAIKVLPHEALDDPDSRARFDDEAQLIAAFEHPAIVPVYDYGDEDGQPYLVMRLMTGGSLDQRISKGAIPLDEAARIFTLIAPALDEAHAKGIIHRDLKPANILFDRRGDPHIADFGIALFAHRGSAMTGNGTMGTPAYMSPEQAEAEFELDGRSDIYSLGVILYEMLTGVLPFTADTPSRGVSQQTARQVPNLPEHGHDLPESCESVIRRATAKEREKRYASAVEMALAVVAAAEGEKLPVVPVRSAPTVASMVERGKVGSRLVASFLRQWGVWIAMSVVLLVAVCAVGLSAISLISSRLSRTTSGSTSAPNSTVVSVPTSIPISTSSLSPTSSSGSPSNPGALKAVIVVDNANVRKGPGTNYGVLATLPKSTELVIKGRNNDGTWLAILTPEGELAWISIRTVTVPIDVMEIEVYK